MKTVSKSKILILVILDVLLIVSVLLIRFFQSEREERMYSQQAGERWGTEDVECAEVSAFFAESKKTTVEEISGIRNDIMKKLYDDTYIDEREGVTHRSWIDAYSAVNQFEVSRNDRSLLANVYGVSDDFFQIHPIPLKSGGYLNPVKTMTEESDGEDPYQIILDENVAWNIFGGNDVAGMKVWMGGRVFTVMGVVSAAETKTEEMAYGNYDAVYVPYAAFSKMGVEDYPITCYEAVMPNPIPNYAFNTLAEACDVVEMTDAEKENQRSSLFFGDTEILDNTNRFSIPALYKYIKSKKYMTMRTDSVTYPYWENVARFEVERASRVLILCCILLILPIVTVIGTIIWLYTKRGVVFNSRNKEKIVDFLVEFAGAVKNRIKHPEPENYDDDEEEPEDPYEDAEDESGEASEDTEDGSEDIYENDGRNPEDTYEDFGDEIDETYETSEEESYDTLEASKPEESSEEYDKQEDPVATEGVSQPAGPAVSALSRMESIREEDDSDDIADHQLNIQARDDLGIELEVVEN